MTTRRALEVLAFANVFKLLKQEIFLSHTDITKAIEISLRITVVCVTHNCPRCIFKLQNSFVMVLYNYVTLRDTYKWREELF